MKRFWFLVFIVCLILVWCSERECPECEKTVQYSTWFVEYRQEITERVDSQQIRYNNENCESFYKVSQQNLWNLYNWMTVEKIETKYSKEHWTCFAYIKASCNGDSDCWLYEISDFINGISYIHKRVDSWFVWTYSEESEVLAIFDSL